MPRSRILPPIKPLIISLALTAAMLLVIGAVFAPDIVRFVEHRRRLAILSAEQPDRNQLRETLDYIARHADDRAGFRDEVIERLPRLDDARFTAVSAALDHAGVWSRRYVPDAVWLRSLGDLANSLAPAARISAAQSLAFAPDLADDPRALALLQQLVGDASDRVRINALSPLGRFAAASADPATYVALLLERTGDENEMVSMHAWLILGWLNPSPRILPREELLERIAEAPPAVIATAQAWTIARLAPEAADRALLPWLVGEDESLRLAARYALEPETLAEEWNVDAPTIELPEDDASAIQKLRGLLSHRRPEAREVAAFVAMQRLDESQRLELSRDLLLGLDDDGQLGGALLAGLADLRPTAIRRGGRDIETDGLRGNEGEGEGEGEAEHDRAPTPLPELRAMSDEQLAGLGHQRIDLLAFYHREADDWAEKQQFALALWMRGETPADFAGDPAKYASFVRNLLIRKDLPRTTVLLALMDTGHENAAFEWLLNPMGQPPLPLDRLLNEYRWHRVLEHYLPASAPPVWRQAHPLIRNLQLEVLRDWALVELRPGDAY